MKKFLTFLIVLIVTFTFGLIIFRLVRNEETISINPSNAYYNVGETINFSYTHKNKNRTTKISVESSDPKVVEKQADGSFKAVGGGVCQIVLTQTDPKNKVTTSTKDVSVGNGSEATPYFVRDKEEFLAVLNSSATNKTTQKYLTTEELNSELTAEQLTNVLLSKHYIQTTNITLSEDFKPVDAVLTGSYRGILLDDSTDPIYFKSYSKIIGYSVNTAENENKSFSSMFKEIGATGKFGYINFENVNIDGSFDSASVVCQTNKGLIDFVSVAGTINNTNAGDSRTAGIAIENIYSTVETENEDGTTTTENAVAKIMRSKNSAVISTEGSKVAGIVYQNNANVLFCVNSSANPITMDLNHAKLTANGQNAIVGGIVGENYYGFGDDLKNEINKIEGVSNDVSDELALALSRRPQVKDCYSTSHIDTPNSGIEKVGGIIGNDIQGYTEDAIIGEDYYKQVYANLTLGNYYLVIDDNKFNSGVGNLEYTKYKVGQIYSSGTSFVALGLTSDQLTRGIEVKVEDLPELQYANLVSYYQDKTHITWGDEGVYRFNTNTAQTEWYLPTLILTENYFGDLSYRTPTVFVKGDVITSLGDFLDIDFTEKTAAGSIKEFTITNWIDFSTIGTRGDDYYIKKGNSENNSAQFVLRGTETGDLDENGNPIYYGFKNISQSTSFTGNTDYMGIFGYVQNSIIENISFVNCNIYANNTADNSTATKAIGILAGNAENTQINNISLIYNDDGFNAVEFASQTANIGGVVGELKDSSINGINGTIVVSGSTELTEDVFVGGIVGKSTNSSIKNIDCRVEMSTSGVKAGGVGGSITGGEINYIKLSADIANANEVGGFAHSINNAKVSTVKLDSKLEGNNVSAGVAVVAENYATFRNASINTEFRSGTEQAGLFEYLRDTAEASNVVHTNNFNNALGTHYAKTVNVTAQIFSGDDTIAGQRNAQKGAGSLTNCFVLNLDNEELDYGGDKSNEKPKTIFYAEQTLISGVQTDNYNPTIKNVNKYALGFIPVQNLTVFGKYGAGILNKNGLLINLNSKNKPFEISLSDAQFGFSADWNFDGFPTINF